MNQQLKLIVGNSMSVVRCRPIV